MEKIKMAIVASEFNYDITYAMVELAKEHARFLGVEIKKIIKVPGVFDMPLAVKRLLKRDDIDCVVTLGAVIEGQTEHDEIVAQHASRKIADLSLEFNKPVALGIAGPGMSRLEAHKRVEYAKRAVESAVKMCKVLKVEDGEDKSSNDDSEDSEYGINPNVGKFLEMG
ncbi:MAG: 6,7-dimethyl-8-ribityllumazine synthase [Candidatus Altiarchaeales archaeon]|nr:MAG: 6,7-dimethyl-8-ribityllumazine synthase [Candidatus Altiarchaeales archaeon]